MEHIQSVFDRLRAIYPQIQFKDLKPNEICRVKTSKMSYINPVEFYIQQAANDPSINEPVLSEFVYNLLDKISAIVKALVSTYPEITRAEIVITHRGDIQKLDIPLGQMWIGVFSITAFPKFE